MCAVRPGRLSLALAALSAVLAACLACSQATATPAATGSPATPAATPATTPTPAPAGRTYAASDLPAIALSAPQIAGWQTATRPDLTGPFTATTNTNPQESPPPAAGLRSGYRQTIGDPGAPGVAAVRVTLELFDSAALASAALAPTVRAYEGAGYTRTLDPSTLHLGPEAAARSGANVAIAPQFAQGAVAQGLVVVWRSGNLLLILLAGGDGGVTIDAAARWIAAVDANARARGA